MKDLNLETFVKTLPSLTNLYYNLYPDMKILAPSQIININITSSLSKSHLALRPDLKDTLTVQKIEDFDNYNGQMVLPPLVGEPIHILLNKNKIIEYFSHKDTELTPIGTYLHELTHAIDFYLMAQKEKLKSYDPLLSSDDYLMFQMWSEYHARELGLKFLLTFSEKNSANKKEELQYILTTAFPYIIEVTFKEYHAAKNAESEMYIIMQLLGRISVWKDIYPLEFNDVFLEDVFGTNIWMKNIFYFLRKFRTLEEIYPNFNTMRLIFSENWTF
ncbi:hypothetical protein H8S23_05130 [Anaerofilum sp. BX8]|uniref:Uncharacterized protein n=1 Tax=Anaerofilum hominis TaxID=2763016 RepID=A0A923L0Q0_9FIRM|nr:hypothetical protein [Anaerofilum hominis]MBC5580880.1 hypothetical protein [Anaerofilum hominis]